MGLTVGASRAARRRRFSFTALVAIAVLLAGLLAPGAAGAAGPPPNPTDAQLKAAAAAKTAASNLVGQLTAKVAQIQGEVQQAQADAEAKQQASDYAQAKLVQAEATSVAAQQARTAAQTQVTTAQAQFADYARAVYMNGSVSGLTGSLLTAQDPNNLLAQSTLEQYTTSNQLDAIGAMQRATVAKSNADAAAKAAVTNQTKLAAAAKVAQQAALAAYRQAQADQANAQASLASTQQQLAAAQLNLATLNNERAAYLAYQHEQAVLAAQRAAKLKAEQEAAARRAAQERAAQAAAERAAQQRAAAQPGGGSSSSSGGGSSFSDNPVPTGGSWTAAKGEQAVSRAYSALGTIYIWDGGSPSGPTEGDCTDPVSPCGTVGFDCSGLTLYSWALSTTLTHYTVVQYNQGSFHPGPDQFMPGDLLFWSSDGTVGGIHHVAIYIGNGNVIQAPESGEHVEITPWQDVDWGYYGATRPLT